jgi:glycosyltransferase involved in cell wall biosynthesis
VHSLLVPVYNAEEYIGLFINHISNLKVSFDEIIFYDDASTDRTAEIIKNKGFRLIEGKINQGPGYARNRLAEQAKGDYIHFHDIDDEFTANFLVLINKSMKEKKSDVIFGNADWINNENREVIIKWRYDSNELNKNPLEYFISHPLGIINVVYKRVVFLSIKGFDENLRCWEDADLHVKLAAQGARFTHINETMAYSLRHKNGISKNQNWCWKCRLKFLTKYLEEYTHLVDRKIFSKEVINVKNYFIIDGSFESLGEIILLNKRYGLQLDLKKMKTIHYMNKFLPSSILKKIVQFFIH